MHENQYGLKAATTTDYCVAGESTSVVRSTLLTAFCKDFLLLKCLIAMSFSPQFIVGAPKMLFDGMVDEERCAFVAPRKPKVVDSQQQHADQMAENKPNGKKGGKRKGNAVAHDALCTPGGVKEVVLSKEERLLEGS